MTSYNTDGTVGPWARDKLKILGDYLHAYTTILRKQNWCKGYFYVDAFAGAGRAKLRKPHGERDDTDDLLSAVSDYAAEDPEEKSFLNGSPLVALDIEHPFTRYLFIDNNPERVRKLEAIKVKYAERRNVEVTSNDASEAITDFIVTSGVNWSTHRGVIFLDPYGMQVRWQIIEQIASTNALEIILNLPIGMAVQRLLPRSGEFTPGRRINLTEFFGSADWEDVVYWRASNLFGEEDVRKAEDSGRRLALWYHDRLRSLFGYSAPPRLIKNSHGGHLYYLMFAGPNRNGAKIARHVLMKQGDSLSRTRRDR